VQADYVLTFASHSVCASAYAERVSVYTFNMTTKQVWLFFSLNCRISRLGF